MDWWFDSVLLLLHFFFVFTKCNVNEQRLYDLLLNNYNTLVRPVENNSDPVVVNLTLTFQQLVDVDMKNQILQTNIWMKYVWYDYQLKWDPEKFGNVTDLRFPVGKIWKPDVLLYNSVDPSFDTAYQCNLIVYNTGEVVWGPPGILRSSCTIKITWFPFDEQECYLKFGSWSYHGWNLDLQAGFWDISEFIPNGEWDLLSTRVVRDERKYDCCPEPYPDLKFFFRLRRRTLYYGFNMIIPSLLISLMTLLGFALPVESGEKVTLEITILLSVCVFLNMVASMTPATSEAVPLISAFFSCNMIVVSASVMFNVLVLNLHYRTLDTHQMSHTMKKVLLHWMPRVLLMKRPGYDFNKSNLSAKLKNNKGPETEALVDRTPSYVGSTVIPGESDSPIQFRRSVGGQRSNSASPTPKRRNNDRNVEELLVRVRNINVDTKFMTERMKHEDEEQDAKNDWKFAAMVIDRLCLYVFSIFIVASTCCILFSAPQVIA